MTGIPLNEPLSAEEREVLATLRRSGALEVPPAASLSPHILTRLVEAGLIESRVVGNFFTCSGCGSIELTVIERCSGCGSIDVDTIGLVHHLECAGVFPLPEGGNHGAVCPKCRAELRIEAPAFERCGEIHRCRSCGIDRPETRIEFSCRACGRVTPAVDASKRRTHRYALTELGSTVLQETVL